MPDHVGRGWRDNKQQTSICKFKCYKQHQFKLLSQFKPLRKANTVSYQTCSCYSCVTLQRLHQELPDAILRQVRQCGHIPHVEKPREAAKLVLEFLERDKAENTDRASSVTPVLTYVTLAILPVALLFVRSIHEYAFAGLSLNVQTPK